MRRLSKIQSKKENNFSTHATKAEKRMKDDEKYSQKVMDQLKWKIKKKEGNSTIWNPGAV